jgi:hypothetical protein
MKATVQGIYDLVKDNQELDDSDLVELIGNSFYFNRRVNTRDIEDMLKATREALK